MRPNVTFHEMFWIMLFFFTLSNPGWWAIITTILFFPRYKIIFDQVWINNQYRKKYKNEAKLDGDA